MDNLLKHWPIVIVVVGGIIAFVTLREQVSAQAKTIDDMKQSMKEINQSLKETSQALTSLDKTMAVLNQRVVLVEQPRR